ncbi:GNAT family N-acetyltransferase [Dyella subtropica]|uniref:GNAT family N-acetyltransferase n=1 Tax=Dyella subtropica TaxID=2992127 RepID=UPI0022537378|nr:GNAT family N-acetyltransferase [Dyella subtropica]
MTIHTRTALGRVSAYLRARMGLQSGQMRLAPFTLTFDAASAEPSRNYATPDDGAALDASAVAALIASFESRQRTPRLEYIGELAPAVLPCLLSAGFMAEPPLSLMTCTRTSLAADGDLAGVEWLLAEREADLHAAAYVQNAAYGVAETTETDVERLSLLVDQGGAVALARACGSKSALGAGLYSPPLDGVTEIAAIGVHADARGRGVGGAVAALLAEHALVQGVEFPFLMTSRENEDRVYGKAGFSRFGELLGVMR